MKGRALALGLLFGFVLLSIVLVLSAGNASAADSGPLEYVGDTELAQAAIDGNCTGDGTETTPYVFDGYDFNCTGSSYGLWIKDTASYVIVTNCTFSDCNTTVGDLQGFAVYLDNASHVTIVANTFYYCNYAIRADLSDNCTMTGNDIIGAVTMGMYVTSSFSMEMEGGTIDGLLSSPIYGIYVQNTRYVTVNDTQIIGGTNGIYLIGCDAVIVYNDTLGQQTVHGIYVDDCYDVLIGHCIIEGAGEKGINCQLSGSLSIQNNTIGNVLTGYGINAYQSNNVSICDNDVDGATVAIRAYLCDTVDLERNLCANTTTYAMDLTANDGRIADNTLLSLSYGLRLNVCTNLTVASNQVHALQGMALDTYDCDRMNVSENAFYCDAPVVMDGIYLNILTDSIVVGNEVYGTCTYGLEMLSCLNVTVSSSIIDCSGVSGLRTISGTNISIMNSSVQGTFNYGLEAQQTYPLFVTGNLIGGFEKGIWLSYCYDSLVMDNDCDGNLDAGIWVEYGQALSNVTVANNSCRYCGYGIFVYQCYYTIIEGNDCEGSGSGIYVSTSPMTYVGNCSADSSGVGLNLDSSDGTTVIGGSYDRCTSWGISVGGSNSVRIDGVDASYGDASSGLNLLNSINCEIVNSTFLENYDGVYAYLDGDHGQPFTMSGCLVENNTHYGLYGYGGWLVTIEGNHFANNQIYAIYLRDTTSNWDLYNNTFLDNAGVSGLDRYAVQCYDAGSLNDWKFNDGSGYVGNGWSHLPNVDQDEDGYVDIPVLIWSVPGYVYYQMPYGPRIEGPSAPTNLSYELTPYYVHLNWTAPSSLGNSTLSGYKVYMGIEPDIDMMWEIDQTDGDLECTISYSLTNGETYYFAVAGFNDYGMVGDPSSFAEVQYRPYPSSNSSPIVIHSDQEFADAATSNGWQGDGSAGDPYVIEDMVIDGQAYGYCIQIWHTTVDFVIRNCTFYMGTTMSLGNGVELSDSYKGRIEGCHFLGDMQYGLIVETGQVNVADSLFDGPMLYGAYISYGEYVSVNNSTFNSSNIALAAYDSTSITIEDCLFEDCYTSIDAYTTDGIEMRRNEHRGGNAVHMTGSSDCLVEDNVGVDVYTFIRAIQSNDVTVRDNVANGTMMSRGAYFENCLTVLFENNSLSGFTYGILATGTAYLAVRNSTLFENTNGAYLGTVNYAELSGNVIRDNLEFGLALWDGLVEVSITRNSIVDNDGFGIYCTGDGSSVTITLNYLKGNHLNDGSFTTGTAQAADDMGSFVWAVDGHGNYWDDWTSPDTNGDGIVDDPYCWEMGTIDPSPLVNPFGAPIGLIGAVGPDHVNLSWDGLTYDFSEGIDGYRVYRGTVSDDLVLLGSTSERWYNDTSVVLGVTYYYRVSAYVGGDEGELSDLLSAVPCDVPGAPTGLTVTGMLRSFQLSWVAPIDDGGAPILGYTIWRGASSSSLVMLDIVGDITSYTDYLAGDGETYYYAVTAFNQAGDGDASAIAGNTTFSLPSVPLNVDVLFGDSNLTVTWDGPTFDGGTPITGYVIEVNRSDGQSYYYPGPTMRSWTVTGLINGAEYGVRIRAVNAVGYGNWSSSSMVIPATVPGAPMDLVAIPGDSIAVLSWMSPSDDGGDAPSSYNIYRNDMEGAGWVLIGTVSGLSYFDLTALNGMAHYYVVAAINKAGEGAVSDVARAVPGMPLAPTGLTAIDEDGSVRLDWTAPADDGGSAILDYKVYRNGGDGFEYVGNVGNASLTFLDREARPGVEYAYKVAAVTARGEGMASAEANITLTLTAPDAPVIDSAMQEEDGVHIAWHLSESSTVPEELMIYRGSNETALGLIAIIDAGQTEYLDMTGVAGMYYAMRASSGIGVGAMGDAAVATLEIVLPPSEPQGLEAEAGDGVVALAWDRSEGSLGYRIYRDDGTGFGLLATVNENEYADGDAVNGILFTYIVTAYNEGGESGNSTAVTAVPGRAPDAVSSFNATAGTAATVLAWTAPSDDGGSAVLGYRVYRQINGTAVMLVMVSALTYTDHSVIAGAVHTYWIVAINAWGAGAESERLNVTTPEAVATDLPAPGYLIVTVGDGIVELAWDPMTGLDVDGFRLLRDGGEGFEPIAILAASEYVDEGLTNGVTYTYMVRCFIGTSEGANVTVDATPGTVPGIPVLLVESLSDRAVLSWTVPDDGGSVVMGYRVYRTPSLGSSVLLATVTGTSYQDAAVLVGVNYTYTVTALNAFGEGSPSNEAVGLVLGGTPLEMDVPGAPTFGPMTEGVASITLTWTAPTDEGDLPISSYNIYRGVDATVRSLLASVPAGTTSFVDNAVIDGVTYHYWVSAVNGWGEGDLSEPLSASLLEPAAPGAPTGVGAEAGQGTVTVTWSAPEDLGSSPITSYRIYRSDDGTDWNLIATVPADTDRFVDGSVEAGVEYEYRVLAVSDAGEGDMPDSSVIATPEAIITGEVSGTDPNGITGVIGAMIAMALAIVAIVLVLRKR